MLYCPTELSEQQSHQYNPAQPNDSNIQHGPNPASPSEARSQRLLAIPAESLTHITSFLDPPSLLALARVSKALYEHVKDDNTWHRAFVYQFLAISPEGDLNGPAPQFRGCLLRRSASTWRQEFINRFVVKRRWSASPRSSITYTPMHSPISDMHLMSHQPPALLASSLRDGIVSRSFPLTGRVVRDHLDTMSGPANNDGGGPFVTSCVIASEGATAKIVWGFGNGEVAVMTAPRAMVLKSANASLICCRANDGHGAAVLDAAWVSSSHDEFATGGADGIIKLWNAKSLACIWTSERTQGLVVDPIVKVALRGDGVVGAYRSGALVAYTDLISSLSGTGENAPAAVRETRISCPVAIPVTPLSDEMSPQISVLDMSKFATLPTILVAYKSHPHFYRISIVSSGYQLSQFSADSAPISCIATPFARPGADAGQPNFIIAGDRVGTISLYDWNTPPSNDTIMPGHWFHAHSHPITAIVQCPDTFILVSASSLGEIKIWDALSFAPIRTINFPQRGFPPTITQPAASFGVEKIVIQGNMLIAYSSSKIFVLQAGKQDTHRGFSAKRNGGAVRRLKRDKHNVRCRQQLEIEEMIADLQPELELEQARTRRALGREREQRDELVRLGLDETEAVAYVLMLSREEEEGRRRVSSSSMEEGVFQEDPDESLGPLSSSDHEGSLASSSPSTSPSRSVPRPLSADNSKVQIVPRTILEPAEAGTTNSPVLLRLPTASEFPAISPNSSLSSRPSTSASPMVSAWNAPKRPATPSPRTSSPIGVWNGSSRNNPISKSGPASSLFDAKLAGPVLGQGRKDDDDDLRFAIQLSMAETIERSHDA